MYQGIFSVLIYLAQDFLKDEHMQSKLPFRSTIESVPGHLLKSSKSNIKDELVIGLIDQRVTNIRLDRLGADGHLRINPGYTNKHQFPFPSVRNADPPPRVTLLEL